MAYLAYVAYLDYSAYLANLVYLAYFAYLAYVAYWVYSAYVVLSLLSCGSLFPEAIFEGGAPSTQRPDPATEIADAADLHPAPSTQLILIVYLRKY